MVTGRWWGDDPLNNCENLFMFRDTLLKLISSERLPYTSLTVE